MNKKLQISVIALALLVASAAHAAVEGSFDRTLKVAGRVDLDVQSGAGNIIAFNGTGVFVHGGNGNAIRRNSIFGNTLGIRYDATSPPIPRAPTPVLTTTGGTLTGAKPNTSYTIEFFSSPTCDSGGFAQGKTFISDTTALTDGNGNTVNRCEGIAFAGGAAFSSEEGYFATKLMRGLGLVHLEQQARV